MREALGRKAFGLNLALSDQAAALLTAGSALDLAHEVAEGERVGEMPAYPALPVAEGRATGLITPVSPFEGRRQTSVGAVAELGQGHLQGVHGDCRGHCCRAWREARQRRAGRLALSVSILTDAGIHRLFGVERGRGGRKNRITSAPAPMMIGAFRRTVRITNRPPTRPGIPPAPTINRDQGAVSG